MRVEGGDHPWGEALDFSHGDRVRAAHPGALVISEMGPPDFRPLEEWGHDAMWLDSLHHALHVALTGEQDGYYADFDRSMSRIAAELSRPEGSRIVACAQNHDQVGNRAIGDRLPPSKRRVAAAVVLFSLCTPLLFQGEEYGERAPFPRELEIAVDEAARTLELRRGRATLRADFANETVELDA